jgi:hypothetical protein
MVTSSFATLEALALRLHWRIKKLVGVDKCSQENLPNNKVKDWQVRIRLEKPVAVPLADGAVVEFMAPLGLETD